MVLRLLLLALGATLPFFGREACRYRSPGIRALEEHLERRYPVWGPGSGEDAMAYLPRRSDLRRLTTGDLGADLGDLRLHTARFYCSSWCYSRVQHLVVAWDDFGVLATRELPALDFRRPDPAFFEVFTGVSVESDRRAFEVATALARALAAVSTGVDVVPRVFEEERVVLALQRDGEPWRVVDVRYSLEQGRILSVEIYREGPHDPEVHGGPPRCPTCRGE
jgi:hypothetical protein